MAWCGLGLLALVAAGIVLTGAPAFLVLLTAASAGGALAVLSGFIYPQQPRVDSSPATTLAWVTDHQ